MRDELAYAGIDVAPVPDGSDDYAFTCDGVTVTGRQLGWDLYDLAIEADRAAERPMAGGHDSLASQTERFAAAADADRMPSPADWVIARASIEDEGSSARPAPRRRCSH